MLDLSKWPAVFGKKEALMLKLELVEPVIEKPVVMMVAVVDVVVVDALVAATVE